MIQRKSRKKADPPRRGVSGRPSNAPRAPVQEDYEALRSREVYVSALIRELDGLTSDGARAQILLLLGRALRHFDPTPAEEEETPLSPADTLALLEDDLPGWSDLELLAAHAEGLRRGIPGFCPREG